MKKFALKGLVTLAAIVLLCVFFSGTLHTITTAKVQIVKAKTGKMEGDITLTGSLVWPETESVFIPGMSNEDSLILRKLCVGTGSYVKSGETLAVCEVSDADVRTASLQESYQAKEKEYYELERKNRHVLLTSLQEGWYASWRAFREAGNAYRNADQEYRLAAWREGFEDFQEMELNPDQAPSGEELQAAWEKREEALRKYRNAQAEYERKAIYSPSEEIVSYLEKKAELEEEMKDLTEEISGLLILKARAGNIVSPHDGYITAADLKAGDTISRNTVLVQITKENETPVIRLDASSNKRSIPAETAAELTAGDKTVTASVRGQTLNENGLPVVDVPVDGKEIGLLGGASAVTEANSVSAKIRWKDENTTTLIPTAALRGSEGDYYVYTAPNYGDRAEEGSHLKITISRKKVTVLSQSGTVTSVEENLKYDPIVYMEDRPLTEGCEVMPYGDV